MLKIIGSIGATCAYPFASEDLHGQTNEPDHHHHDAAPDSHPQPQFFSQSDFAMVSRIADLIIPATDTPGAIGAGVPAYIDLVIARNTDQQLVAADGLRWVDAEAQRIGGKSFIDLSEPQQLSILEPLCEQSDAATNSHARNVQFFSLMKSLTADGYYTSRIGLMNELKYKGNQALVSFPACK
jgi:hypothetical protein